MDAALDLGEVDHRVAECRAVVPVRDRPGGAAKATPGPRTAMLAPPRGRCRVLRRVFGASLWPPGTRPPQDVERPGIGEGGR
jgi:hypothetical protein